MSGWNYLDEPPKESGRYKVKTTCGVSTFAYFNSTAQKWEFTVPYSWVEVEYWRPITN